MSLSLPTRVGLSLTGLLGQGKKSGNKLFMNRVKKSIPQLSSECKRPVFTSLSVCNVEKPSSSHGPSSDDVYRRMFAASAHGAYKTGNFKFWIRHGIYLKSIMLMIDPDFDMTDFLSGAQKAFSVVMQCVDAEDLKSLDGILTSDAIYDVESMSFSERQDMMPADGYSMTVVPDTCGLITNDTDTNTPRHAGHGGDQDAGSNRRWFEIVVSYLYLRRNMEDEFKASVNRAEGRFMQLTEVLLRCSGGVAITFIREYTRGVDPDGAGAWTINRIHCIY